MAPAEVAVAALLHREHFPAGFLAQAGERVLRAWYEIARTSPHAVTLVARDGDGRVLGYLFGTADDDAHRAYVVSRWRVLGVALACGLVRRPRLALRFLRTRSLRYARRLLRPRDGGASRSP